MQKKPFLIKERASFVVKQYNNLLLIMQKLNMSIALSSFLASIKSIIKKASNTWKPFCLRDFD
jgi:hypothetical protein